MREALYFASAPEAATYFEHHLLPGLVHLPMAIHLPHGTRHRDPSSTGAHARWLLLTAGGCSGGLR